MKNKLLTVIVPAYKFSNYIEECLLSIVNQKTNFEFDVLVRDDGSFDGTQEKIVVLQSSYPKIKMLDGDKNLGAYGNIKKLVDSCKTRYVSYIDGDDYFTDENKLQKQIDFLESNPDFSMHCTAYKALSEEGKILPLSDDRELWFSPMKEILFPKDLLEKNLVTFGRTFRNSPGLLQEWMEEISYLDWAFNFEISLRGKIICENWPSGIYRYSNEGMFSLKTQGEKDRMNLLTKEKLARRFKDYNRKITIIDCFIRNDRIESKLLLAIDKLKNSGEEVLLITNTKPSKRVVENCDYLIYDKRNRLLKQNYTGVKDVDFHITMDGFSIHNIKPGVQRHALSVLSNLHNSLVLAKSLGYRFFQRIEVDDMFGESSMSRMQEIYDQCLSENKLGCFYFNEDELNVSFHFFLCEIDFMLDRLPCLVSEDNFREWIFHRQGNYDFIIAEEFIYQIISKSRDRLMVKDGKRMLDDFPDTTWNTETSGSNIDPKYGSCVTGIYRVVKEDSSSAKFAVVSYNYGESPVSRRIECFSQGHRLTDFHHTTECLGAWVYNFLPNDADLIKVFDGDLLLFEEQAEEIKSFIKF